MEFEKALILVSEFFHGERRPFLVIGAFALHAYGLTRATRDLDFAAEASVQEKLIAYLSACGYETLHRSAGYSNHLHSDPALGRLDFVYVDGPTAEILFGSAHELLGPDGLRVPVPKAEHLATMVKDIERGKFEGGLRELMDTDEDTLKELYTKRELEPEQGDESWTPTDKTYL